MGIRKNQKTLTGNKHLCDQKYNLGEIQRCVSFKISTNRKDVNLKLDYKLDLKLCVNVSKLDLKDDCI